MDTFDYLLTEDNLPLVDNLDEISCQIKQSGYRRVKMDFFYCECDPEQKDPICQHCFENCHKKLGHLNAVRVSREAVCSCGKRAHRLEKQTNNQEQNYSSNCYFYEITQRAGIKKYFKRSDGSQICLFCSMFCCDRESLQEVVLERPASKCDCYSDNHKDIKVMFKNINSFSSVAPALRFYLTPFNFFNLIFLSDKIFSNFYYDFEKENEALKQRLISTDFSFSKLVYSKYNWALSNFANLCENNKYPYYPDNVTKFFDFKFVFFFLEMKFNVANPSVCTLKYNLSVVFKELIVKRDFCRSSQLKIEDLTNLSPVARQQLTSAVKALYPNLAPYYQQEDSVFFRITKLMEKYILFKSMNPHILMSISNFYKILKKLASQNAFSRDDMVKLCQVNDEFMLRYYNYASKERLQVQNIVKILFFFVFNSIDNEVVASFESQKEIVFWKSEVGESIAKNMVNALSFFKHNAPLIKGIRSSIDDFRRKSSFSGVNSVKDVLKKVKDSRKALTVSRIVLSTFLNNPDYYFSCTDRIKEYVLPAISKDKTEFLDKIVRLTDSIEDILQSFFEYNVSEGEMLRRIKEHIDYSVDGHFDVNSQASSSNFRNISLSDAEKRNCISQTCFVTLLFKVLEIINSKGVKARIQNTNAIEEYDGLFDKILQFFEFYGDSADNCSIILSSRFLDSVLTSSHSNLYKCFELLLKMTRKIDKLASKISLFDSVEAILKQFINQLRAVPCLSEDNDRIIVRRLLRKVDGLTGFPEAFLARFLGMSFEIEDDISMGELKQFFIEFTKIASEVYIDTSSPKDIDYLQSILSVQDFKKILNKEIDAELRTYMIKMYFLAYVHLDGVKDTMTAFTTLYTSSLLPSGTTLFEDKTSFQFFNTVYSSKSSSIQSQAAFLLEEFERFFDRPANSREYVMTLVNLTDTLVSRLITIIGAFKGSETLNFYKIVFYFLQLVNFAVDKEIVTCEKTSDVELLERSDFEVLNYKRLYEIYRRNSKKMVVDSYIEDIEFSKEKDIEIEECRNKSTLVAYLETKNKQEENCLFGVFDDQNVHLEASYRQVFVDCIVALIDNSYEDCGLKEYLEFLLNLLLVDTNKVQECVKKICLEGDKKASLEKLFGETVRGINLLMLHKSNNSYTPSATYYRTLNLIKILKFLCEEHNMDFQTAFFQPIYNSNSLFNLSLNILNKIILISEWESGEEGKDTMYFYDLFSALIELLIEIIQGTDKRNLVLLAQDEVSNESLVNLFNSIKNILLKNKATSERYYSIRRDMIEFVVTFVEEKNTPIKVKQTIYGIFSPNMVFKAVLKTMKTVYAQRQAEKRGEAAETVDRQEIKKVKIFDKEYLFFKGLFYSEDSFSESVPFQFANRMFQYIKLFTMMEGNFEDAKKIVNLTKIYELKEIKLVLRRRKSKKAKFKNVVLDDTFFETFFVAWFFEAITRCVYVKVEGEEYRVLFTVNPNVKHISESSKNDFVAHVDRDGRHNKLYALLEHSEYFQDEIEHNVKNEDKRGFFKFFVNLNFFYFEVLMFFITLAINLVIFFNVEVGNAYERGNTFRIVQSLSIMHIVLNALLLMSWLVFKSGLFYMVEVKKYCLRNKLAGIGSWMKAYVFTKMLLLKSDISFFIWNILLTAFAFIDPRNYYIFSIELLAVVNLSVTLKNIINSITLRKRDISATFFLVIVTTYVFSFLAYKFIDEQRDFEMEVDSMWEDKCGSLLYCFLTHVTYGIRSDGAIGTFLAFTSKVSFNEHPWYYMVRFVYELGFWIVIILLQLSIVFGIVIETFAELREESSKQEFDKANICFICGGNREDFEKECISFENHVKKTHNVFTYIEYIISLKHVDIQETNAINSFVIEQIADNKISWFPIDKAEADKE